MAVRLRGCGSKPERPVPLKQVTQKQGNRLKDKDQGAALRPARRVCLLDHPPGAVAPGPHLWRLPGGGPGARHQAGHGAEPQSFFLQAIALIQKMESIAKNLTNR